MFSDVLTAGTKPRETKLNAVRGEAATKTARGHSCPQQLPIGRRLWNSRSLLKCRVAADRNVRAPKNPRRVRRFWQI